MPSSTKAVGHREGVWLPQCAIAGQLIIDGLASAGWSDLSSLSHAVPVSGAATREAGKPPVTGVILIIFAVWMVLE